MPLGHRRATSPETQAARDGRFSARLASPEPERPLARSGIMAAEDYKQPESRRDRITTTLLLTAMVVGGGFATIALLKGAWDLIQRYGGL